MNTLSIFASAITTATICALSQAVTPGPNTSAVVVNINLNRRKVNRPAPRTNVRRN